MGACPRGAPGCPDWAASTMSTARNRMVLMASWSTFGSGIGALSTVRPPRAGIVYPGAVPGRRFDSRPLLPYNVLSLPDRTERCWSGRTGLPAKQLSGVNPDRGFESLPLRHSPFARNDVRLGGCTSRSLDARPFLRDAPQPSAARFHLGREGGGLNHESR